MRSTNPLALLCAVSAILHAGDFPGGSGRVAGDSYQSVMRLSWSPVPLVAPRLLSDDTDGDGTANVLELDNDADSLPDRDELLLYGTAHNAPDTDHDGMPDAWEVQTQLNPIVTDGGADADEDGLLNLEEYDHGWDPQRPTSLVHEGWNLLGTPWLPPPGIGHPEQLQLPVLEVLAYQPDTYQTLTPDQPLQPGIGYLVFALHADSTEYAGDQIPAAEFSLVSGWNLISVIHATPAEELLPDGPIWELIPGGYRIASLLRPGRGYWFYSTTARTVGY